MDVIKSSPSSKFKLSRKSIAVALSVLAVLSLFVLFKGEGAVSIDRDKVLIAEVKRGDLSITVDGYGVLESEKQQLITAISESTVKEILIKPGVNVDKESLIAKLENPDVRQALENAKQEYSLVTANHRELQVHQKRELLDERANLKILHSEYKLALVRKEALEALLKDGITSKISYQESLFNVQQLKSRLEIQEERISYLDEAHKEALNIAAGLISQEKGKVEIAQRAVDSLEVRPGFSGMLQRLPIELGQSLRAGDVIALIGSVDKLRGVIKVPQSQASKVTIGQHAIIDTRQSKINGLVSRIDPIVENNTVNIEISITEELPSSARPNASIDGIITVDTLQDVHYVKRPANIKSESEAQIYLFDKGSNLAALTAMTFGQSSGRYIEVISGAMQDDRLIISDVSSLVGATRKLTINH